MFAIKPATLILYMSDASGRDSDNLGVLLAGCSAIMRLLLWREHTGTMSQCPPDVFDMCE